MPNGTDLIAGVAVVPLIVGLVQVAKASNVPDHFTPLLALALGLVLSLGYAFAVGTSEGVQWAQAVFLGLAYGLSASGLYSGTQAVVRATTKSGPPNDGPPLSNNSPPVTPAV